MSQQAQLERLKKKLREILRLHRGKVPYFWKNIKNTLLSHIRKEQQHLRMLQEHHQKIDAANRADDPTPEEEGARVKKYLESASKTTAPSVTEPVKGKIPRSRIRRTPKIEVKDNSETPEQESQDHDNDQPSASPLKDLTNKANF